MELAGVEDMWVGAGVGVKRGEISGVIGVGTEEDSEVGEVASEEVSSVFITESLMDTGWPAEGSIREISKEKSEG